MSDKIDEKPTTEMADATDVEATPDATHDELPPAEPAEARYDELSHLLRSLNPETEAEAAADDADGGEHEAEEEELLPGRARPSRAARERAKSKRKQQKASRKKNRKQR